jgi:hypothetical protein
MSQHDYNIANQGFSSFRSDLNNALSAIQTNNSGTSRPTGAVAGQMWLDTTNATSPTLKFFDGSDDISLATINYTANTVDWLDSSITITGLSTTATGTVLTLSDTASTSSVNLIIDNQKEVRFRETTANGTNYVALKAPASVSADLTFTLPATDGTSGQVLQTNGSGVLSFVTVGGLAWQSVQTSGFTAVAGRGYPCNTTSSAFTVTLPASATAGDTIILVDYARTWGTNKITINQNSLKFQGYTSPNPEYNTNGQSVTLVYVDSTQGWIPTVDDDVTNEVPQTTTVDFIVLAGGSAGARSAGGGSGGGGAGGYRSSNATYGGSGGGGSAEASLTFNGGSVYTVTVGAGGTAQTGTANGASGSNSSLSGSGITTITSTGGGGGSQAQGVSGGCGGGSGENYSPSGGSGTANQGFAGGAGDGGGNGGGGGGTGAVGVGATSGRHGGAGTASTITGSSVTRGGGGGGCGNGVGGTGGSGGGGNGGAGSGGSGTVTSGTANTGGGGGAIYAPNGASSGAGGSGVVILRMLTSKYSGTTTGSPTVSTSGTDTILTYTGSGSYTA